MADNPACGARLSAYGHWHCQLKRWHFGSHRFNSYLGRRIRCCCPTLRAMASEWSTHPDYLDEWAL
jgi:hypothetical protein